MQGTRIDIICGYPGTRVPEYMGNWVPVYLGTWVPHQFRIVASHESPLPVPRDNRGKDKTKGKGKGRDKGNHNMIFCSAQRGAGDKFLWLGILYCFRGLMKNEREGKAPLCYSIRPPLFLQDLQHKASLFLQDVQHKAPPCFYKN